MTAFRSALSALGGLAVAGLAVAGCASGPVDVATADAVPLRIDKANPERLVRSLFGGYLDEADPFDAGLVSGAGEALTIHPQRLDASTRALLQDANGDGAIDWDEVVAFVGLTYTPAQDLPPTLDDVYAQSALAPPTDSAWFSVDVDGVMTAARRRVSVPLDALRSAIDAFASDGALVYPAGTLIVGAHLDEAGATVETTVKRRRADGFWTFAVYDADGRLTPVTSTPPLPLKAPTQCTGCHLGQKLYEPEKSFPAEAADGPFGPRAYYVPDAWRSAEATALFQEHARRDDGVLGLYATLYTGRLLAARADGSIAPDDAALLDRLGL